MEPYQYSPILPGELTRVLALQPSKSRFGQLHGDLLHVDPDFPFVAISYAWGMQYAWSDLIIKESNNLSLSPPSVLRISSTVKSLLYRMRASSAVRYLWIDAICINQADETEKMQQVSGMFGIYSRASQVLAWLGDEGTRNSSFLEVVKRMGLEGDGVLEQHLEDRGSGPLQNLFGNSWFGRRWVIQEVAAARSAFLVEGGTHINFDTFAQTLGKSNRLKEVTKSPTLGLVAAISRVRHLNASRIRNFVIYPGHLSFAALFQIFHNAECSDDRDRIYALLGLDTITTPWTTDIIMMPDYRLSTTDCYEMFAMKLAARSNEDLFTVMQCAGAFPQEHVAPDFEPPRHGNWERAPSWIPDWTMPRLFRPLYCSSNSLHAGHVAQAEKIDQDITIGRVIRLNGLLLGRITHMSTLWCEGAISDEYMIHHVLTWWLVLIQSGLIDKPKYSGASTRIVSDFVETITAGQTDLQFEPVAVFPLGASGTLQYTTKDDSYIAFRKLFETWLQRAKLICDENSSLVTMATDSSLNVKEQFWFIMKTCYIEENIPSDAHAEVRRVHQIMEGRAIFVTDSGNMGICSSWAATGDMIGIPIGASTPFVFRSRTETEASQGEQRVSLVSDCYLQGFMKGQVFKQSGIPRRTFVVK